MDAIEEILREKILGRITELENRKDHAESITARSIIDIRLDELHSLLDRWGLR